MRFKSSTQVRSSGAQLAEAGRLLDDGIVRIVIDSCFPLTAAAHARAAKGGIQGKIVLSVAGSQRSGRDGVRSC